MSRKCSSCGKRYNSGSSGKLCDDCENDRFFRCEKCGRILTKDGIKKHFNRLGKNRDYPCKDKNNRVEQGYQVVGLFRDTRADDKDVINDHWEEIAPSSSSKTKS